MARKDAAKEPPSTTSLTASPTFETKSSPSLSSHTQTRYLPTTTEILLYAVYPSTLILGSAFSHLSPSTNKPMTLSTYSHSHQSYQPAESAPSYFATKKNIFNVYFVKIGWFWCTIAFMLFVFLGSRASRIRFGNFAENDSRLEPDSPRRSKRISERLVQTASDTARLEADTRLRRRYQAIARYLICTLFWVIVTQWFFGAPLIDRGFSLTGGICEIAASSKTSDPQNILAFTHAACKRAGGRWKGGYDISGHVFLLVLGSGMLWAEMIPIIFSDWWGIAGGRILSFFDNSTGLEVQQVAARTKPIPFTLSDIHQTHSHDPMTTLQKLRSWAFVSTLGVALLSCWMLLMTSAFFHTWSEKTLALILATIVLYLVYVLPRAKPRFRAVVGMPGI